MLQLDTPARDHRPAARTALSAGFGTAANVPAATVAVDIVDQWGAHSFPASDPPANW